MMLASLRTLFQANTNSKKEQNKYINSNLRITKYVLKNDSPSFFWMPGHIQKDKMLFF